MLADIRALADQLLMALTNINKYEMYSMLVLYLFLDKNPG